MREKSWRRELGSGEDVHVMCAVLLGRVERVPSVPTWRLGAGNGTCW